MVRVMIRQVVDVGRFSEEFGTAIKIDANGQRARLRGFVNGDTRQQLSPNLQAWRPVCRRLFNISKLMRQFSHRIEIDGVEWHPSSIAWQVTRLRASSAPRDHSISNRHSA